MPDLPIPFVAPPPVLPTRLPDAAPTLASNFVMPPTLPQFSAPPLPNVVPAPTQLGTDMAERNRLISTGDGISQIHNPFLHGLARTGDVLASVFAPNLAQFIPGTSLHHNMLVGEANRNVQQDQQSQLNAATLAQSQATTRFTTDKAQEAEAPAGPEGDASKTITTDEGIKAFNPQTQRYDIPVGDAEDKRPIEERAYEAALAAGKSPTDALGAVYNAKNVKDAALPQQYLDAIASGDNTKAGLIRKVIQDTSTAPKIQILNAQAANRVPASGGVGGASVAGADGGQSALVQSIIDGRTPAPNSRSKAGMAIMAAVTAADPSYDASRYQTYQRMQTEMTSGKTGGNINSLNTVLNHINDGRQHLPNNGGIPAFNAVGNYLSTAAGGTPTTKFDVDTNGIAGEFSKLVNGGVATQGELDHVQKLLNHNGSKAQMQSGLDEIENLVHGKLDGIYKQVQSANHPGRGSNAPASLPAQSADPLGIR